MESTSPQHQTPVLAGLIAFGVLAIALGGMNLKRLIGPRPAASGAVPTIPRTPAELEVQQRALLVGLDADRDGLSDLDELDRTRTSPYLADSDSDGKTDKEEVDADTDPNCPIGKTCATGPMSASSAPPKIPLSGFEFQGLSASGAMPETSGGGRQLDISVDELRQALERQGVSRATLDALSDADLLQTYGGTLGAIAKGATGTESPLTGLLSDAFTRSLLSGKPDIEALIKTLPTDALAVRKLLEQSGVSKEQLGKINDQVLLQIWQQVLADLRKQRSATVTP